MHDQPRSLLTVDPILLRIHTTAVASSKTRKVSLLPITSRACRRTKLTLPHCPDRSDSSVATSKVEALPLPTMPKTAQHSRRSIGPSHSSAQSRTRQVCSGSLQVRLSLARICLTDDPNLAFTESRTHFLVETRLRSKSMVWQESPRRTWSNGKNDVRRKKQTEMYRQRTTTQDRKARTLQGATTHSTGSTQGSDERQSARTWADTRLRSTGRTILSSTAIITTKLWRAPPQFARPPPTQPPPGYGGPPPGHAPHGMPRHPPPSTGQETMGARQLQTCFDYGILVSMQYQIGQHKRRL